MSKENSCSYCNKNFSTKGNCTKHMKKCKAKELHQTIENKDKVIESLEAKNKIIELEKIIDNKDEQIEFLKSIIETYAKTPNIQYSYSNNSNNYKPVNTVNNFSPKEIVSKLDPVDFDDIKNFMHLFSKDYVDQGIKGFANFLCEHPCKEKIITTDHARKTIAYRTKNIDFIRDFEATYLINRALKENCNEIIDKTNKRKKFYKEKLEIDEDSIFSEGERQTISTIKELKQASEQAQNGTNINDKDIVNIISNYGSENINKIINNLESANAIE
jgi:hypothetical protein